MARGTTALAAFFDGGAGATERDAAIAQLSKLPRRVRTRLMEETSIGLRRGESGAVSDVVARLGLERRAHRWCASRRWWRRARGVHQLSLWGNPDVRPELLADRHPVVRAQAIEWAGDHPTPALIELVLERLADPILLCRQAAQNAALRAGPVASGAIARSLETADGPDLEALLFLAARRSDASFYGAALRRCGDERPGVRAGAAALLGGLGGAEGTGALETLLSDPDPEPRAAAAGAIGRLRHWPAAASVAALLVDESWDVRRAAGEALAAMGPPGTLTLGQHARGGNEVAAEAARYALDVARLRHARSPELGGQW